MIGKRENKSESILHYNEYEITGEYEDAEKSGKSIEFKLLIIEKEFTLSLDNNAQNEMVCCYHVKPQFMQGSGLF